MNKKLSEEKIGKNEDNKDWGSYGSRQYVTDPRDEAEVRKGYQGPVYDSDEAAEAPQEKHIEK